MSLYSEPGHWVLKTFDEPGHWVWEAFDKAEARRAHGSTARRTGI